MTLRETIDELQCLLDDGMSPDTPVHVAYNYGDYWRTTVAPAVKEVAMGTVVFSKYHEMDKLSENDDDNPTDRAVVVIS